MTSSIRGLSRQLNLFNKYIRTVLLILFCSQIQAEKLIFDPPRGLYENPFELTIRSPDEAGTIHYTLDGSDPLSSETAVASPSPAVLMVDPGNSLNRDVAPGVCVRAIAVVADTPVTNLGTHTYLFVNRIGSLSPDNTIPGPGWPESGGGGGWWNRGQTMDYGMDPDVLEDPRYRDRIVPAMLDVPSFSMVMDLPDLFDSETGIYFNAAEHGDAWERGCSLELLNPDGSDGFHINCGVRIRGGWSRQDQNPKHAFRYFFRAEYGESKLRHPLFEDEGVDEFDKIDLRCTQNYAWSFYGDPLNTFLRDVFSRDLQRDMGQPYTRSRYYHLYINGTYWGLFQTQERSEASYAEAYFGGNREDYDVIKVDAGYPDSEGPKPYDVEATDGTLERFYQLWQACETGFEGETNYYGVLGLNPDGTRNPELPKLVDLDNLIDYMINAMFVGDFDGPVSDFRSNNDPNNFYAVINREDPFGFIYFRHDAEHSLFDWRGVDRTGPFPAGNEKEKFNPQWLHQKLTSHPEYRLRFADRVYKHFFNDGALTVEANIRRWNQRREEIDLAIIAESARWGDAKTNPPRTRDDDWLPQVQWPVEQYFPGRNETVLDQFQDKGWYPEFNPPQFNAANGIVAAGFELKLSAPEGQIYYTTDGTDPHDPHSESGLSATAAEYSKTIEIDRSTHIKTRLLLENEWSALNEVLLAVDENMNALKLTEIHYHPNPEIVGDVETDGDLFEFIELKNVGGRELNLTGTAFVDGIYFDFGAATVLKPGTFFVLCSSMDHFRIRYGFDADGQYSGNLRNSGERIILLSADGDTLFNISYDDELPWPVEPDSTGQSLVARQISGNGNPREASYWIPSSQVHGSPKRDDGASPVQNTMVSRPQAARLYQNYPNPFNPTTTIHYSVPSDGFVSLKLYNTMGEEVHCFIDHDMPAGDYRFTWDATQLAGGLYLLRMFNEQFSASRKCLLVK